MGSKKFCVVLPTRNEEHTIVPVIANIREDIEKLNHKILAIIVVDDSRDNTRRIARDSGAIVISGGGRGLGLAMFKGLKKASNYDCDYILSMDTDGQNDTKEIENFLVPLENGEADLVLGSRFLDAELIKYKYKLINRTGIRILVRILRWLTGYGLTDSHGGLRIMRREVACELEMLGTHTYVQETIIDAVEKGFRIAELPSVWLERQAGGSRVVGSISTYIFYTLPILLLRGRLHIKWLYTIGIVLNIVAVLYFLLIAYQADFVVGNMWTRLPSFVLIALMVLSGIMLFFFGFILQLLIDLKYQMNQK